jgi:hypothetical protein
VLNYIRLLRKHRIIFKQDFVVTLVNLPYLTECRTSYVNLVDVLQKELFHIYERAFEHALYDEFIPLEFSIDFYLASLYVKHMVNYIPRFQKNGSLLERILLDRLVNQLIQDLPINSSENFDLFENFFRELKHRVIVLINGLIHKF